MTESIIRETTRLRAEMQHGSVDTRFVLPALVKEQAMETKRSIKEHTGVPVDYTQVLIMAIRRGLAVINNEITAEYNADLMDYRLKAAEVGKEAERCEQENPNWRNELTDEQKAALWDQYEQQNQHHD